MELSIREAKARFSEAIAAAEKGEQVVVTRHGVAVANIVASKSRDGGFDFEAADKIRKKLGLDKIILDLPDDFDVPAFSRNVLGLDDE